jgi:hypothetical protein
MESMDKNLNITVNIDGISLPLTVHSTEEEKVYRDAANLIQTRLRNLRERYPNVPSDKYHYAMVLLYTGVDAVRASNRASTEPYKDMINDLEKEIDELLKKK